MQSASATLPVVVQRPTLKSSVLILAIALAAGRSIVAQGGQVSDGSSNGLRQLRAVRAASTIALDGTLDEPAWAVAPLARNFVQSEPREGEPATFDTEVRVLYDDDALYFGVFAKDEQPAGFIVSDLKKVVGSRAGAVARRGSLSVSRVSPFVPE